MAELISEIIVCQVVQEAWSYYQSIQVLSTVYPSIWRYPGLMRRYKYSGHIGQVIFHLVQEALRREDPILVPEPVFVKQLRIVHFKLIEKYIIFFLISLLSAGMTNKRIEFLSICLRNLIPSPFPSWAPSIIPGISAMTNDLLSR